MMNGFEEFCYQLKFHDETHHVTFREYNMQFTHSASGTDIGNV